jgi:hypothetical protein
MKLFVVFSQPWLWGLYVSLKCWYLPESPQGVTTKKTEIYIFTAMRTSNLIKFIVKLPAPSFRRDVIWETLSLAGLAVWGCNRPRAWKRIGIHRLREKFAKEWCWIRVYWCFKDGGLWNGRVRNHSYRPAWIGLLKWQRRDFTVLDRLEVFTSVKMTIVVFWIVMACGLVRGYQCFGGTYHLHLRGDVSKSAYCCLPIEVNYLRFEVLTAVKMSLPWMLYGSFKGTVIS